MSSLLFRRAPALLCLLSLSAPLAAQTAAPERERRSDTHELERVQVSALPLQDETLATPVSVQDQYDLLTSRGTTLGDTLRGQPGVHVDTFGAGAGRPVIRGQTAPRVKVLSDGSSLMDASDVSPDHAITSEPMLMRQVEVLRGPAALLYGGGAIGGVVNVLDDKVPTRMPGGHSDGFLSLRGNTVAEERAIGAGITVRASEHIAVRAEGASRRAHDYEVNGFQQQRVPGSYAESDSGSVGASWILPNGYIGAAYTLRKDEYGLPGHSHDYADCHPHGSQLHCGGGGHHHHHDDVPYVDLKSERFELRGDLAQPWDGVERLRFRGSYTDYGHDEIDEQVVGTRYETRGYDGRVELEHRPLAGWHGVVGVQYQSQYLGTFGTEAFLPETRTQALGVFLYEHYRLRDDLLFEAGLRQDYQRIRTENDPRDLPGSSLWGHALSTALTWSFRPGYELAGSLARSQRLPHAQELYANGVHLATNTYECGLMADRYTCGGSANDAGVKKETSHNVGLNLRKVEGPVQFDLGAFYNRVDNYIYARTLDRHNDFSLIKYTHADAVFYGGEAELTWFARDDLQLTAFADAVVGEFAHGKDDLPRIPPYRWGGRVTHYWQTFSQELEFYRVAAQRHLAAFEQRTGGYDMVNLTVRYQPPKQPNLNLFVQGRNLLGERVWNHTSFLAHTVPEPGRNLIAGLELTF